MKKNKWLSMIKLLPFTLCIILILCYLISNKETAIQTIINYTPETPWLAAFIILLLYLLKSLLVIFPILILEIASGHLFSTIPAIIINSIGILGREGIFGISRNKHIYKLCKLRKYR